MHVSVVIHPDAQTHCSSIWLFSMQNVIKTIYLRLIYYIMTLTHCIYGHSEPIMCLVVLHWCDVHYDAAGAPSQWSVG